MLWAKTSEVRGKVQTVSNIWVGGERERGAIIGLEVTGYGWGL